MARKNTNKKTYILDTNVLLSDSEALVSFDDNDIILPLIVLEELDRHKDRQDEAGRNARETSRKLLELVNTTGNLRKGAPLMTPATGTLRTMSVDDLLLQETSPVSLRTPAMNLPSEFNKESGDNIILTFCVEYKRVNPLEDVTLVTRDILLRIKADILKVPCQDYRKFNATTSMSKLYTGTAEVTGEFDIDELYEKGELPPLKVSVVDDLGICPNQFLTLKNEQDGRLGYARFIDVKSPILCVDKVDFGKIEARNKEQEFAVDLLMDPNVKLVTMAGKAGSGKTLVALAAGLKQVLESQKKLYKSLVILRPIQPMGKDIGFLPGTIEEKMEPWIAPIKDNLRFLLSASGKKSRSVEETMNLYFEEGTIEIEAMTFIRGRSIANAFIIVDEAQNLDLHELKTILTRVGENTKIVLTGDIEQIDALNLNALNNGLTITIEKFKTHGIAGHVTLVTGERSELANLAANIL